MLRFIRGSLTAALTFLLCGTLGSVAGAQVIYVPQAPPPVRVETEPPSPGATYAWVAGHWYWDNDTQQYVWIPGHYVRMTQTNETWVPGHWVNGPNGWYWVAGRWRTSQ